MHSTKFRNDESVSAAAIFLRPYKKWCFSTVTIAFIDHGFAKMVLKK